MSILRHEPLFVHYIIFPLRRKYFPRLSLLFLNCHCNTPQIMIVYIMKKDPGGDFMAKQSRYKQMEQLLTRALIISAILFVLYLITASASILWLKVLISIVIILLSVAGLGLLYMSKELLKQRSLWLTTGFFGLLICVISSLVLAFP